MDEAVRCRPSLLLRLAAGACVRSLGVGYGPHSIYVHRIGLCYPDGVLNFLQRSLPRFGILAAVFATSLAAGSDYRIHPGDQLSVSVYGEPTLTQTVTVLPDSTIAYPLVGRVAFENETPSQAADTLRDALSKYVRNPIVSVGLVTEGQLTVMVLGNVKLPGKYALPFNSRVTDAIAAAGGLGPTNGDLPDARVTDEHGAREASLQGILRKGDVSSDIQLGQNSVVYVQSPVTIDVKVLGAVDHPGAITVNEGDRLSDAIARAGNSTNANADLNNIRVTRIVDGTPKTMQINLYKQLENGDLGSDIVLQKSDVVYVPKARTGGQYETNTIFGSLGRFFGIW